MGLCGLAGRREDRAGGDPDRAGLCGTVWASREEGGQRGGRDPDRAGLCGTVWANGEGGQSGGGP